MLSGADDRVFCNCGDQGIHERQSNGSGTVGMAVEELRVAIRDALVPVIVVCRDTQSVGAICAPPLLRI